MNSSEDVRRWMDVVYRALVEQSPIPSEPRRIGQAAVEAMARSRGVAPEPLPAWFGEDLDRDLAWLTARLPDEGPWWAVYQAMAWDSGVPHTAVVSSTFAAGMAALTSGEPWASPGFFLWRQPDGRLAVADLDERGSGHASGLRQGDVVISADDLPVRRANSEVLRFYAAPAGSAFSLQVEREGGTAVIRLVMQPGEVPAVVTRRMEEEVGYLSVRWFSASADPAKDVAVQARSALKQMADDGARGLVVDLRSGLGGHPAAVVGIASALCSADVVLSLSDGEAEVRDMARSGDPVWLGPPIAVLLNEQTISAAEYLALALSELAGAVLVGTPTAGGLNTIRATELAEGYRLLLPQGRAIGPRSRRPLPGDRLQADVPAANPTASELAAGLDPALETARRRVLGRAGG